MTAINPPFALQNAGTTHTAENDRMMLGALFAGIRTAGSMVGRGGVNPMVGNLLKVQQQGSPTMAVDVLSGHVYIPGSEGSKQGVYSCTNDATVAVAIAAAHATLPRIDLLVVQVQDTAYSGGVNSWSIAAVTGTPAGSPVAPAAPNNSITLAQIAVGAAVTSIVNGNITDLRFYAAALGGMIPCTSTTRPAVTTIPSGQLIYETDTGKMYRKHTDNSWWPMQAVEARKTSDEIVNNSATLQDDDQLQITVDANATYVGYISIPYGAGNTADLKAALVFPSGTLDYYALGLDTATASVFGAGTLVLQQPSATSRSFGGAGTGNIRAITYWFRLMVGGSGGTFKVQWAQDVATVENTTVKIGGYITATRTA